MKRNIPFFSFLVFVIVFFTTIFVTSCKLGLGETVDVLPPELSIDYPPTNSVIRDSFIVKGVASDDVGITAISVTFNSLDYTTKKTFGPYDATLNGNVYTVTANNLVDGEYEIPDGKYELVINATDATGRVNSVSRTVIIDNTAPVLVLSQPSSTSKNFPYREYGTRINITGAIGESNYVNQLVIEAFHKPDSGILSVNAEPDAVYSVNEIFPQNLDHRIYIDNDFYTSLYPVNDTSAGNKDYYFKICIKDNAKEYKNPGDSGSGEGNKSSGYLVNDTNYVNSVGERTTLEVYNMYDGSYYTAPDGSVDTVKKAEAIIVINKLESFKINQDATGAQDDRIGSFTLNPQNAPVWSLSGINGFGANVTENDFAKFTASSSITVETSYGRDSTPIDSDSISVVIKKAVTSNGYLVPSSNVADHYQSFPALKTKIVDPITSEVTISDVSVSNPETRNACVIPSADGFNIALSLNRLLSLSSGTIVDTTALSAGSYFVEVSGWDANKKDFIAEPRFGFTIQGQESPPTITVNNPNKGTGYIKKNGSIDLEIGLAANSSSGEAFTVGFVNSDLGINTSTTSYATTYNHTVNFDGKTEAKEYVIKVTANQGSGISAEKDIVLFYDPNSPIIDVSSISPIVIREDTVENVITEVETVNGIITINGNIIDTDDALSTPSLQLIVNGPEESVIKGASFVSEDVGVSTFAISNRFNGLQIDTTKINSKQLKLVFTASDRAGNKSEVTKTIEIDQDLDKPQIELTNASMTNASGGVFSDADVAFGKNFFGKTSNSVLQGTISDDDGVSSLEIAVYQGIEPAASDWKKIDVTEGTTSASWRYDVGGKAEGIYKVKIRAKDTVHEVSKSETNTYESSGFAIGIIESKPTITLTSPSQYTYYNGTIPVSLKWTDSFAKDNSTKPVITAENTGGNATSTGITGEWNVNTWIETLVVGDTDNVRTYTISDRFGQTAATTFTYNVDTDAPKLSVTKGIADGTVVNLPTGNILRVEGTASDIGSSGLDEVKYIVTKSGVSPLHSDGKPADWSTWVTVDGLDTWTANVDFTGKKNNESYDVFLMSKDVAGNYSAASKYTVKTDTEAPTISIVSNYSSGNSTGWNPVSFKMTVADTVALASYEVTLLDGTKKKEGTLTGLSKVITLNTSELALAEGKGSLIFTVKDKSGKSTSSTVDYKIDTAEPIVTITNVETVGDTEEPITKFRSKNDAIYATFSDVTSGAKGIETINYTLKKDGSNSVERNIDIDVAENLTTKNIVIPVTKDGTTLSDGIWNITITATDDAFNKSVTSRRFRLDTTAPNVKITAPTANSIVQKGDDIEIRGTADETNGMNLDRVEVSIIHQSYTTKEKNAFSTTITGSEITANGDTWSWSLTGNNSPFTYDGEYKITAIAYDLAGNTRESIVSVACDAEAPTFKFTQPYPSTGNITDYKYETTQGDKPTIGLVHLNAIISDFSMKEIWYQVGLSSGFDIVKDGSAITRIKAPSNIGFVDGAKNDPHEKLKGQWMESDEVGSLGIDIETTSLTKFAENVNGDIGTLYIHVVGIDQADNIGYAKYPLLLDTNLDKPVVRILSPDASSGSASVGGAFVVSGSATDNTGISSVQMQIEVVNGNYNTSGDLVATSDSTTVFKNRDDNFSNKDDWYEISTETGWNYLLNSDGNFNATSEKLGRFIKDFNASSPSPAEIIVRIKALDDKTTGKAESATKEITVKIDGGSPSIVETTPGVSIPQQNSSVSGNFPFSVTVTDDESIGKVEFKANGVDVTDLFKTSTDELKEEIWVGKEANGKVNSIDLSNLANSNVIKLEIIAKDNSQKESTFTRTFVVDNTAPTDRANGKISTTMLDGTDPREPSDRGNHLRIKTKEAFFEGRVADEGNGSGVKRLFFYFTQGEGSDEKVFSVRKNSDDSVKYNPGVAMTETLDVYDAADNVTTIPVPFDYETLAPHNTTGAYIVVDKAEGYVDTGVNGDNDGFEENLRVDGFWGVNFDSTRLRDGVYTINYLVEDNAGNIRYYEDSMLVQNSAPVVTGLELSTGSLKLTLTPDEFMDNKFQVRNYDFDVKVLATGDNGILHYDLIGTKKDNSKLELSVDGPENTVPKYGYFSVEDPNDKEANFPLQEITSGVKQYTTYTVNITDSLTDGSGTDLSLQSGEVEFKVQLANADNLNPSVELFDLNTRIEYNKPSDDLTNDAGGSLYVDSDNGVTGHVEPRVGSGNHVTADQQVSGEVILRGRALDNQSIAQIAITIDNGAPIIIAEIDDATKKLTAASGATVKQIIEDGASPFDDVVYEWSYIWNTEDLDTVAGLDIVVSVSAEDVKGSVSDVKHYAGKQDDTSVAIKYNKDKFDVMPYITSLSRNPSEYKTVRSRLGYNALLQGETLFVEGFNVKGGKVKVTTDSGSYIFKEKDDKGELFDSTIAANGSIKVPSDAISGFVSVIVNDGKNNVESTNNVLRGSNDKAWNKESVVQLPETKLWTNDRYMYVWSSGKDGNHVFDGSTSSSYPSMTKASDGQLYASFATNDDISVYYTPLGESAVSTGKTKQPSLYTDISVVNEEDVYISYLANFNSDWNGADWNNNIGNNGGVFTYSHQGAFTYDTLNTGGDTSDDVTAYYGQRLGHQGKFLQFTHMKTAATTIGDDTIVHTIYYDKDNKSLKYSGLIDDKDIDGTEKGRRETAWINIDGVISDDDKGFNNIAKNSNVYTDEKYDDNVSWYKGQIESSYLQPENYIGVSRDVSGVSPYFAIDLDDQGFPVIVYITTNGSLRVAHACRIDPRAIDKTLWNPGMVTPAEEILPYWQVQEVATGALDHASVKVDEDGIIHIAYRNTMGNLCYVKSTNDPDFEVTAELESKKAAIQTAVTNLNAVNAQNFSVANTALNGALNDQKILMNTLREGYRYLFITPVEIDTEGAQWVDLALDGTVPYISYLPKTDSYDAMRMAYLVEGSSTGPYAVDTWEYIVVPLEYKPQNDRTHIETNVKYGKDGSDMKVAIGFPDGDAFRVTYLVK